MIKKKSLLLSLITASMQLCGMNQQMQELERAMIRGDIVAARTALEALEDSTKDPVKEIWLACKKGDLKTATSILTKEKVDVNMQLVEGKPLPVGEDADGSRFLHFAAYGGHAQVVELLLDHNADANACDNNGWSPLIPALVGGHVEVVDLLIAHGADVNKVDNKQGYRPIATPIQCLNPRLVEIMLKAGAQVIPPQPSPDMPKIHQDNALHILCNRLSYRPQHAPEYTAQEAERRALEIVEIVREHGIDVIHQNGMGNTIFHIAAQLDNSRLVAAFMVPVFSRIVKKDARKCFWPFLLSMEHLKVPFPKDIRQLLHRHLITVLESDVRPLYQKLMTLDERGMLDFGALRKTLAIEQSLALITTLCKDNKRGESASSLAKNAELKIILNPTCWH